MAEQQDPSASSNTSDSQRPLLWQAGIWQAERTRTGASRATYPGPAIATKAPAPQAAVSKEGLKSDATRAHSLPQQRRWATPRTLSTTIALVFLVLINIDVQLNHNSLDALSDGSWRTQRVLQCESLGRKPDVLYLGSSRTVFAVDPHAIDAAVEQQIGRHILSCNAGVFGSTIEQDYYSFKRLIEDGLAPKLITETIWEWNLNTQAAAVADNGSIDELTWIADISDVQALHAHARSTRQGVIEAADFIASKLIPIYRDRIGLYRVACGALQVGPCGLNTSAVSAYEDARYRSADRQGWVPITDSSLAPQLATPGGVQYTEDRLRAGYLPANYNFTVGGRQPDFLAKLIQLAQAHGVRVALVTTPLHQMFRSFAFDRPTDLATFVNYCRAFAQAHHVEFYDQSDAAGYGDDAYADPSHLNATGAGIYSAWLAKTVVSPMLQAQDAGSAS